MEKYVEYISNDKLRTELAAFRLSAHNLDIERGRNINDLRENRVCRLCSMSMVKSAFHFLLVCPRYNDITRELLPRTAWPAMAKFVSIIASNSQLLLLKLSTFIMSANTLRFQKIEISSGIGCLVKNILINLLSHASDSCKDDICVLIRTIPDIYMHMRKSMRVCIGDRWSGEVCLCS